MNQTKTRFSKKSILTAVVMLAGVVFVPAVSEAGSWSFSLHVPFYGGYWCPDVYEPLPIGYDYYPIYNPVVERDVYYEGHRHWGGRVHRERVVEDRHATYYSPGRNEAITPPRTTVQRRRGPGYVQERERTSWIGADGRPHSTTITRTTRRDFWGNTYTDTHVSLKNRSGGTQTANPGVKQPSKVPVAPKPPAGPKVPRKKGN